MSVPTIRRAGAEMVLVLAELHARTFSEAWPPGEIARLLATPGAFALLAVAEDTTPPLPLGFALLRTAADECELLSLAVLPDRRRQGVARMLLGRGIEDARAAGAVELFLEVAENNVAARALYLGLGFRHAGRRPEYYQRSDGKRDDALVLKRDI
ncbi:GNAT family N-acetyltransferase [Oceanibacterium hippocampi]|uniref:Ribosomal-protein-alanine N-acetyltransferase n=1 Tax=Oceanibacterium hippocampi TaxID=745714 RepID=A0A1Y5RLT7_9PROT|nr:GNAT family N-acetyltransferase [Oceanibacterium hippocampi]SLN19504.1 ribosomal-protein-alanine N-acetyltransferase [Oceanibacterium hippocampi]